MNQDILTLAELAALVRAAGHEWSEVVADVLPAARVIAVSGVREHFQQSVTPEGQTWARLKHPRPDGGNRPLQDKGTLAASITGQIVKNGIELKASHPGAALHQYGGTIAPKVAKALAIPLTREAKRIGSPRQNHFPRPLFALKGPTATVLAERVPDGVVAHYVLKSRVVVPARRYLGFSRKTLAKIDHILADRAMRVVLGAIAPGLRIGRIITT